MAHLRNKVSSGPFFNRGEALDGEQPEQKGRVMASIEVDIDIEDHLDEVSTHVLKEEIRRRLTKGRVSSTQVDIEEWAPSGLADDLRTAFYARNANRFELLLTVLQPHEETPGLHRMRPKEDAQPNPQQEH
jgi:hypothetical protein